MMVIKLFFSIVVVLLVCYIVTIGTSLVNQPSDLSVLIGVIFIFMALVIFYYAMKMIWFQFKNTFTNNNKEQ